jgi:hypothetical protein
MLLLLITVVFIVYYYRCEKSSIAIIATELFFKKFDSFLGVYRLDRSRSQIFLNDVACGVLI